METYVPAGTIENGISDIRLIPEWDSPSIEEPLQHLLCTSDFLQAAVAYWTVTDRLFGASLPKALGHSNGFLCVDLHLPTDVDALNDLVRKGAHVYLYIEDIPTLTDEGLREPPCLMHSKMLLFRSLDQDAELWVGSHNWTNRAILGLNVESSLSVKLKMQSPLFSQAEAFLAQIRAISHPFDPEKVPFYKEWQKKQTQRTTPVIRLEAKGAATLGEETIALFGTDSKDLKELGGVPRNAYVMVFDTDTGKDHLYPTRIVHAGLLSASDSAAGGISFTSRRFAFRKGRRFPVLLPDGKIGDEVLEQAEYFLSLALSDRNDSLFAEYVPRRSATWEEADESQSPLLRRMSKQAKQRLFGSHGVHLSLPVVIEPTETELPSLEALRNSDDQNLVVRCIIRPRR